MQPQTPNPTPLNLVTSHPAVGQVTTGTRLNTEEAKALSEIFSWRITRLNRQAALAKPEVDFVNAAVTYGARNLLYFIDDNKDASLLPPPQARELLQKAGALNANRALAPAEPVAKEAKPASVKLKPVEGRDIRQELQAIATDEAVMNNSDRLFLRASAEDFAETAVTAFGAMVAASGGQITLNQYLAYNFQHMLTAYEAAEPQPGA